MAKDRERTVGSASDKETRDQGVKTKTVLRGATVGSVDPEIAQPLGFPPAPRGIAPTYVNENGVEVVDVVCPVHSKVKGHVATGQLGKATCGMTLKSHKEAGSPETVDGKKVTPTRTVIDVECKAILVPAFDPKGKKQDREEARARGEKLDAQARASGKKGKGKQTPKAKHPDAV